MTDAVTPANIFHIGFGFWASKVLLSAVELGLFTELAKGPADLATVSQRLGLHDRSARDFLDALVALNCSIGRMATTATPRRRLSFSTGRSLVMRAVFSKWQTPVSMSLGAH